MMNSHFTRSTYFLGVNGSSSSSCTFIYNSPFGILETGDRRRAHDRSVVIEKIHTTHKTFTHRMICMISRRASHFDLQVRETAGKREGARVAWDAAYCRILSKYVAPIENERA